VVALTDNSTQRFERTTQVSLAAASVSELDVVQMTLCELMSVKTLSALLLVVGLHRLAIVHMAGPAEISTPKLQRHLKKAMEAPI